MSWSICPLRKTHLARLRHYAKDAFVTRPNRNGAGVAVPAGGSKYFPDIDCPVYGLKAIHKRIEEKRRATSRTAHP
jgi:hypothetical protein